MRKCGESTRYRKLLIYTAMTAALVIPACSEEPIAVKEPTAASIVIATEFDRVSYRDVSELSAAVLDADGGPLVGQTVAWSSSDPLIARVSESGAVTGVWPGIATIVAQAGAAVDSVDIVVHTLGFTPECRNSWIPFENHGFRGLTAISGGLSNRDYVGHTLTYRGTPLLWGAGIAYGTNPLNMILSANSATSHSDIGTSDSSCEVPAPAGTMRTVSLVQPSLSAVGTRPFIPGLTVVQEQFAFDDPLHDDYVLFRYTFQNVGSSLIEGLRFAAITDFDVVTRGSNVASYDPATHVADAVTADSVAHPQVIGFRLIGLEAVAYDFGPTNMVSESIAERRARAYSLLSSGFDARRSGVQDVWQLLAAAAFDLAPGASKEVWYAIAAGNSRAEMYLHMQAAITKAQALN